MTLPLTKLEPFYPGQWGVVGSDDPLGIRTNPQGIVWYVDGSHPLANDDNDGTSPDAPLETIQAAIIKNNATINWANTPPYKGWNWIVISPGEYDENLTPPYYCKVLGLGMATGNTTDICVDIHPTAGSALAGTGLGCHWSNIRFTCDDANPVIDFGVMNSCIFENCMITDGNPGLATVGIDTTDANSSWIVNCRFTGNSNPVTIGIRSTGDFYSCVVKGCQIEAVTTGIHLSDAAGLAGNALITQNNIAYPVNGIICATGAPLVTSNWIAASVDAISHPDANRTIDNHTIVAGAGAIETAGT
jgi:hypothetical protein